MTASRKPKTPSMTITVAKGISDDQADAFARRASRLTLSQVVEKVTVDERLTVNNRARRKEFTIEIAFYPEQEYRAEFDVSPVELVHAFGNRFPLTLKREVQLEIRRIAGELRRQTGEIGKGRAIPQGEGGASDAAGNAEEDVDADVGEPAPRRDDDDESEAGDGDASREKSQRQKQQQASYESDEDEDIDGDIEPAEAELETASALDAEGAVDDELEKTPRKKFGLKEVKSRVEQEFLENFPDATSFDFNSSRCIFVLEVSGARPRCIGLMLIRTQFDTNLPKLMVVDIVGRTCRKTVVREIPGITDCFRVKEPNKDGSIKVSAVSMPALRRALITGAIDNHQWLQLPRSLGGCVRKRRVSDRGG
jgi:DNA-directed RNA polymerase I subunit RPA1